MTRSTWSGGVTWSGTGKWMPDGLTASGRLMPSVSIGGNLQTACMSASWRLGISGFLDSLSPGTCTLMFTGAVYFDIGSSIVLTVPDGTLWVGRVDTVVLTYPPSSNIVWTTITGTDTLGALGAAELVGEGLTSFDSTLLTAIEQYSLAAGVVVDAVDMSSGLPYVDTTAPYTGSLLGAINAVAATSNAMLALQRDGSIGIVMREAVTPSGAVDISNRYDDYVATYSAEANINKWFDASLGVPWSQDTTDIAAYGERTYSTDAGFETIGPAHFDDWTSYGGHGGSPRALVTVRLPLKSWADSDLMLLNPFDWTEDYTVAYQVMSIQHDATPDLWTVTLNLDPLLDLL